ncbi:MAG: DUF2007 domain-containing protein [Salinivirgaceae bacterium]|jgi:hypothetical protein|nr:DUF2007 domain-containing protein [Salinivirgaceae bacterium]
MGKDWAIAYSTGQLYLAEMVKDILEDNQMEVVLMNKQDTFYHFGEIEVYVRPEDIIRAKFIIKEIK